MMTSTTSLCCVRRGGFWIAAVACPARMSRVYDDALSANNDSCESTGADRAPAPRSAAPSRGDAVMCGIVGTIDAAEDRARARVTLLNECQQHRGPDHSALTRVGSFTLGNTRLAIQEPGPAGNQ